MYELAVGSWVKKSDLPSDSAQIASDQAAQFRNETSLLRSQAEGSASQALVSAQQAQAIRNGLDDLDLSINTDPVSAGRLFNRIIDTASITDFGGKDDSEFDNVGAYFAAKATLPAGGRILFPKVYGGRYYFNGLPNFGGVVIDPDEGVEFDVTGIPQFQILLTRDLRLWLSAWQYGVTLRANIKDRYPAKKHFMNRADIDDSETTAIASFTHSSIDFANGSDDWQDATAKATAIDQGVRWAALTNDGKYYASLVTAVPGEEITAGCLLDANYFRAAVVRGTAGYQIIIIQQNGTAASISKVIGQPATISTFSWNGKDDYETYNKKAMLTIRPLSQTSWTLLVNGMQVSRIDSLGFIQSIGFGVYGNQSAALSVDVIGWIKRKGGVYRQQDKFIGGQRAL